MTPILFDGRNASAVYSYLKEERGICLTPCGGDLKDLMVRVAHIGNHVLGENDELVGELSQALAWAKGA
jgi:aspartate aminotransferase-like enzyme